MTLGVVLGAAVLCALHLFGGRVHFITYVPRSKWLSFAGGASVAYVFLHLLPEVAAAARAIGERVEVLGIAEDLAWLLALVGLALFYAIEVRNRSSKGSGEAGNSIFWFSMASYAVYNFLIGYLLHRRSGDAADLALFVIAMALHFMVNDIALREHHKEPYRAVGRWVLVAAVALGAAAGLMIEVPEAAIGAALAFIGGGVILNVMKEELPDEAESSFASFATGAASYALLLLVL